VISSQEHPDIPTARATIEMRDIVKRFGSVTANDRVTFTAFAGEVHALVGENGAGKSTLMSILAGMYRPDGGEFLVEGEPVAFTSPRHAIERGIGMVYQHFMLVEPFTVTENVMLGLPGGGLRLDRERIARELVELSRRYTLEIDPHAAIWQLSVGEQQRVEILRVLHRGAKILVFDEPTAVLTPQESRSLLEQMRQLADDGFTVIFISHKLNEVLEVSDRITVLRRGAVVSSAVRGELDRVTLARMMVGRDLASALLRDQEVETHVIGDVQLRLDNVVAMGDKGLSALRGVSFDLHAGETLGIAGVAGNGQRELAEVITGLRPVTSGTIQLGDREITNQSARRISRSGVAHIPEDRLGTGLVGSIDLSGNAILRAYRRSPIARGPFLVGRAIASFTGGLISNYDVKASGRNARVGDLSGGNQQKLLIARELSGEPRVIVAVHPTRGVDVGASEAIHSVLWQQRKRGAATLLISEDLDELLALSDRIAVIFDGQIIGIVDARTADIADIGLMMAGIQVEEAA
jgi:simple sugar transport system ATP-binding protein